VVDSFLQILMATDANTTPSGPSDDAEWDIRLRYWRRKLGRLRLGVEPIAEQLARYRRVTIMLTAIPLALGAFFLALFSAFGRPDVGAVFALSVLGPVIAVAWLDFGLMSRRAARFGRELREHETRARARMETKTPDGP
jgi:hypothetical protein